MELIYIGIGILMFFVIRALHKIRVRDQEETDKKIAFAKWAKAQQDPQIVTMAQKLMREGRFKTWEEAASYAEQAFKTQPPEPRADRHANDTETTPS